MPAIFWTWEKTCFSLSAGPMSRLGLRGGVITPPTAYPPFILRAIKKVVKIKAELLHITNKLITIRTKAGILFQLHFAIIIKSLQDLRTVPPFLFRTHLEKFSQIIPPFAVMVMLKKTILQKIQGKLRNLKLSFLYKKPLLHNLTVGNNWKRKPRPKTFWPFKPVDALKGR